MASTMRFRGQLVYRTPHVSVRFEPNKKGIARIAVSNEMWRITHHWAAMVAKPYAISISPRSRRKRRKDKKHYADSFEVHSELVGAPPSSLVIGEPFPMMRWSARLVNTAEYAVAVEWGGRRTTERQTSHRVLGKTLARFRRPTRPRV